jgi:NitT/TauT family transport system substrate-binding protein
MTLTAGCSAGSSGGTLTSALYTPEKADITVAAIPAVDLAGLFIAQDDGFFAEQGLKVKIVPIASSAAVIADQLKGQVDISAGAYEAYIAAEAIEGAKFRILAEASTLQPDTRVLVTPPGSPITTIADLRNKRIGVNGTNSIGTLLIRALLQEHGIPPGGVNISTDQSGFPVMPGELRAGIWDAAFLAEPYVTIAAEQYGEQVLADLGQGATLNFPVDGYVTTQAWAKRYPRTTAAFLRALEEGQQVAATNRSAVGQAMQAADKLQPVVTEVMALPDYPTGAVNDVRIQRVAADMLQFDMLSQTFAADVRNGSLIRSMTVPG